MSTFNTLFALLSANSGVTAIVGASPSQIYQGIIPQSGTVPCIVCNVITGTPDNIMDGAAVNDHEVVQVDAWALDYSTAVNLRDAIRAAFENQAALIANGIGAKVTDFYPDSYESETRRFLKSIGLSVWTAR